MAGEFGQAGVELRTLEGMTPEERKALVSGEYLPERLMEFTRSRNAQEEMLRRQANQAYQLAYQPVEAKGRTTPAAAAHLTANVLRMMGGMAMGKMHENELAAAQGESRRQHDELMRLGEGATDAGMGVKRRGLSDALIRFGGRQ
jgi:hypothetical protein